MAFAETLTRLRREKGLSQEQLADLTDVSRQAVGKWEAGRSMPDLPRLIALADLFGVSLDALVRPETAFGAPCPETAPALTEQMDGADDTNGAREPAPGAVRIEARGKAFSLPSGSAVAVLPGYEYKSKRTLFGLPLVHINVGYGLRGAKGVFAVGDYAVGVVAVGGFSVGLIGIGGLSVGLLGLGGVALGGLALGGLAVGGIALGACAVGVYALGVAAVASKAAVGAAALAPVSAGFNEDARFVLTESSTLRDVADYLRAACPDMPRAVRWLLTLGQG